MTGISSSTSATQAAASDPGGSSFWDQLQDASFRGVPFFVRSGGSQFGRRNAVHEYPFRDTPWVEDLGKSARRFQVAGFIEGDDVIAQRDAMIAAVEKTGDGELVHPTYGRVQVAVIGFDVAESAGRTFDFRFTFVRQGQRLYPSSTVSGADAIAAASTSTTTAAATAFATAAAPALADGAAVINRAGAESSAWAASAQQVGNTATSLIALAVTLPGNYGRLLGLADGLDLGQIVTANSGATLASLTAAAAAARAAISVACAALTGAASTLGASSTSQFAAAAAGVAAAVLAAAPTPGDALRSLATLAGYTSPTQAVGSEAVVQGACADLFRRAAVVAMAAASSAYQPRSSDDAAAVRTAMLDALDAEIDAAGDQFEDDVYSALRELRAQVVSDLNTRGAQLPNLQTVTVASSLPSLVLAQRLYRDASRADELVSRANPVHPAFMPMSFEALSA